MNKTKIEWCDYTWNPVTGCLHDCPYCYARGIARRFGIGCRNDGSIHDINEPQKYINCDCDKFGNTQYGIDTFPFGFDPTFHRYRLDEPQRVKKPSLVFVCSMADMFGDWVPAEWIDAVFDACAKAPQHRYLFLTKNSARYSTLYATGLLPKNKNFWYGSTITAHGDEYSCSRDINMFLSIEPIKAPLYLNRYIYRANGIKWAIVGAETGNRKNKVVPKREWIENIVDSCRAPGVPIFMKSNLKSVWGEELIQEYPEGLK